MRKISRFLSFFDEEFWSRCCGFLAVMAISVCLQSLLFRLSSQHQMLDDYGLIINIGLFALPLFWAVVTLVISHNDMFPLKGTAGSGLWGALFVLLMTVGVYAFIICPSFHRCELLVLVLVMMWLGWAMLEVIQVETHILSLTVGSVMCYSLGTYFAMRLSGLETPVEVADIVLITAATAAAWFRPLFEPSALEQLSQDKL